ncbi:MAG: acetate--CoA ligase family protein [Anaerolineae bacterium]
MSDPLQPFFYPNGVAVIGASSNPNKLSYGVLHNLATHGYQGPVYPVNPKGGEILGLNVYPSVADVPDPVELAVIILPPELSIQTLDACGQRGIKAAVVVASGFGELGSGGEQREAQLQEVIARHGMRLIGPNCIGVLDTTSRVDTTFLTAMPARGGVGFASHSGAICGGTVDWANTVGFGFSRIISLGNQVDVNMADALASLAADPHTHVAVAYIEGLPHGRAFVTVASSLTQHKPLVVVKAGQTPSGTRAVQSHTGALAGENRAFQAACHRAGAIQVEDLQELLDASVALDYCPPLSGPRTALLTNAGGPAAVGADALDRQGLHLVELSAETQDRLNEVCPPGTMTRNPVDMLGGAEPVHYRAALHVLLDAPEVDGVLAQFVPQALTGPPEVAESVGGAAAGAQKPVVCSIYGGEDIHAAARILHASDVPHYLTPARAAFGLGVLWRHRQIHVRPSLEPQAVVPVDRDAAAERIEAAHRAGQSVPDAHAAAQVAGAYGISVPPSGLAGTADEAVSLAARIGYPVALKRVAPGVVHKSDVGGVALGLRDATGVRESFQAVVGQGERAFVQKMAPGGLEIIVGAQRDPQFGPLVMFGLGGVYVEVLEDLAFRLAPLNQADARDMVMETAAGKLLAGVRGSDARAGQPPRDIEAVVDTIRRVGQLIVDRAEILEIDLNPLIVGQQGAAAVDVRIVLQDEE